MKKRSRTGTPNQKLGDGKTSEATRRLRRTDPAAYKRQHYAENKDALRSRQRNKARERKAICVEHKGGKCHDCGISGNPVIFDFDHRDPSTKTAEPCSLMAGASLDRIFEEIDKCDMVCANCHRLRTFVDEESSRAVNKKLRAHSRSANVDALAEVLAAQEVGFSSAELFGEQEYDEEPEPEGEP